MPRFYSSKHIISVLQKHNFVFMSQKGSHVKYSRSNKGQTLVVIIPANRKEIPLGTFHSILRQAGMKKEEFK